MIERRALIALPLGLALLSGCGPTDAAYEETITLVGVVETSDPVTREVLLRGQAGAQTGALVTMRAGTAVQNFAQIRPGDRVTARYFRAVAAHIVRASDPSTTPSAEVMAMRAAPGERPAGAVGDMVRARVRITSVDTTNNIVGFVGPNRQPRLVVVRNPAMQQLLRSVSVGDQVDIVWEEALAVAVTPAV
jgi:hypothetical protein